MTAIPIDCSKPVPNSIRRGVVTIGNFDGVHFGHHRLLAALRRMARTQGLPAFVLCLDPHPLSLLRPNSIVPSLMSIDRKVQVLRDAGADAVGILNTTRELLELEPEAFVQDLLFRSLEIRGIVEGEDFRFGKNRRGDTKMLADLCEKNGVAFDSIQLAVSQEGRISSSAIRQALSAGDVATARMLAGRPHRITGMVAKGDARGRTIGFPTANLEGVNVMLPEDGVYCGHALLNDGCQIPAAINIGPNPTFGVGVKKVEAHLIDFEGDIYGMQLSLDLIHRIRGVDKFASVADLITQIEKDVANARLVLSDTASDTLNAELAKTIAEFVRMDTEPTLAPAGGKLLECTFATNDEVCLKWKLPELLPRSQTLDLALHLDDRIRSAFPEVRYITHQTVAFSG